ncbi:aminotransferase class IV [Herbiconiux sp. 11R-BC]|uniref:aminotransferase class IV n=1 Tax=Herbiconiux sp. 11R-BC TaxID=3111637 RepID=UPI003C0F0B69
MGETGEIELLQEDTMTTIEAGTALRGDVVVFAGTGAGASAPRALPLAAATVSVADLSVTRGDGVFESIAVLGGRFVALDAHLARLAHSAAMLDLPAPDLAAFEAAARLGVEAHTAEPELLVKLVYTRGLEASGAADAQPAPSGWAQVMSGPDHGAARTAGIRVVTLDRGYRHDVAQTSPWLLQGAKTLSYALNKAALREAARRGADDVIFVSSDGVVLEGPTSTVLVRHGDVFRTPRTDLGILAGTTQALVFDTLAKLGFDTAEAVIPPEELAAADAVWLLSSGRLVAPVRELDGRSIPVDAAFTATLLAETFGLR